MANQLLLYRIGLASTLGIGYFVYRKLLSITMINQNLLLNQIQTNDLYQKNFTQGPNNAIIAGHSVNKKENMNSKRKVIIIGAGIIGIAQSLKLLQEGYNVILIDKEHDIAQQCSYFNGCVFVPQSVKTMINRQNVWTLFKGLFNDESTLRFNTSSFFEKYFLIWSINALIKTFFNSQISQLVDNQLLLGQKSIEEIDKLKQSTNIFEGQFTSKKLLGFYNQPQNDLKNSLNQHQIKYQEIKELSNENGKLIQSQFPYIIDFDKGSNMDTREVCSRIIEHCLYQYPNNFYISTNTNVKGFTIDSNGQIIGTMTSSGIILGDYFIIAAAHKTKYLTDKLGIRLPIMPIKGWTLGFKISESSFFKDYTFSTPQYFSTFIQGEIRLSSCAEIGSDFSVNIPSEEWGAKLALYSFNKHFNKKIDMDDCFVRSCYRPITPDDIPIISSVPTFNNVYVNTGHGSKGMTYSFGSAEILYQIMKGNQYPQYSLNRFFLC